MQNRSVGAGSDDGVVADLVAFFTGDGVERALQHALRTRLAKGRRNLAQNVVETMLGCRDRLAHLTNLILILAHACLGGEFVQLVIGSGVVVRIGETVGFTDLLDHAGQLRDVVGFDAGHRGHFLHTGTRTHPILAIMGVHEKVLRVMVGTRSHEQFRNMRLAGLRLRRIRIDGIQNQHRAGLEILTQTGVVGERRIRTERVIAIVVAHLRLSGRNHDTLARERLAQRLQTRRRVLGGLQRLDLRLVVIPTGGHELLERLGTRTQRTIVHTIAHGLIRSRSGLPLHLLVFLVLVSNDFAHHIS